MGVTYEDVAQASRAAAFGDLDFRQLLGCVTDFVGGEKAILLGKDRSAVPVCNLSIGHDPDVLQAYQSNWRFEDPRRFHSLATPVGECGLGQVFRLNEEIKGTEYYSEVSIAGDVSDSLHGVLSDNIVTGRLALSVHRGFKKDFFGNYELHRMKAALPLLRDAIDTSIRVAMLRGEGDPESYHACIGEDFQIVQAVDRWRSPRRLASKVTAG